MGHIACPSEMPRRTLNPHSKRFTVMIGAKRLNESVLSLIAILILVLTSAALAQEKIKKIDDLIGKYYEYKQFNGTVLVAEQGKVLFKKGYGDANKEWDIPNTPETKFRLGSITKQFTATIILQLAEQEKLRLDGKITDYLEDYPKATGDKITISHLLSHTSGIPGYTELPNFGKDLSRNPFTPKEFIKVFCDLPLQFEPGTKFTYSNSGYFLLGVIIEQLTSKPYAQVVDENIFRPLGMKNSGYDMPGPVIAKRAAGYQKQGSGFVNAAYLDMTVPYSAGSLYSTVEDLYVWDQALYGTKVLSERSKAAMFQPRISAGAMGSSSLQYAYVGRWVTCGSDPARTAFTQSLTGAALTDSTHSSRGYPQRKLSSCC